MTIPSWPDELPKPQRSGYQSSPDDVRLAKSVDAGPVGWRKRTSSVSKSVSFLLACDRSEKAVFDQFFSEQAEYGSLPFWMPDPVTDGWLLLDSDGSPLLDSDGAPLLMSARWLCLFGQDTPVEVMHGLRFHISFSVRVMP